jgi:GAF domain-containing protein
VIDDVNTDPRFAPHRDIAAASRFRAVQSTPLVDLHGHLVGVLSTHYPRPHRPSRAELDLMKRFGELIGQAIEASMEAGGPGASLQFEDLLATLAARASRETGAQVHTARAKRVSAACRPE